MKIIPMKMKKIRDYLDPDWQIIKEYILQQEIRNAQTDHIEDVYYTLLGQMVKGYEVEGVENAFAPGSRCEQLYAQVFHANQRISARLKAYDEDPDVTIIINNLLDIEFILCYKMYLLGAKMGLPADGMPHAPSNAAKESENDPDCTILPFHP